MKVIFINWNICFFFSCPLLMEVIFIFIRHGFLMERAGIIRCFAQRYVTPRGLTRNLKGISERASTRVGELRNNELGDEAGEWQID